jgi:hypothetical protein
MSQSKVSRIETGWLLPSVVDVEQILTALAVDQSTRAELLALARVANAEYHDVRASVRRGLHHRQREIASLVGRCSPGLCSGGRLELGDVRFRAGVSLREARLDGHVDLTGSTVEEFADLRWQEPADVNLAGTVASEGVRLKLLPGTELAPAS